MSTGCRFLQLLPREAIPQPWKEETMHFRATGSHVFPEEREENDVQSLTPPNIPRAFFALPLSCFQATLRYPHPRRSPQKWSHFPIFQSPFFK